MKQYLFYACSNKYERGPLELQKQICVKDNQDAPHHQANADEHMRHYRAYFEGKEFSVLHILVLHLDPANGITEVLTNEYAENPLKVRTIINPQAKGLAVKKKSILNALSTAPMYVTNHEPEFFDDPDQEPEEEEAH
jgi:hypothetical protein